MKNETNFLEILKIDLPCDLVEFKDSFLDDDAVFGFTDMFKHRGDMISQRTNW